MTALLDTHTLVLWLERSPRLPAAHARIISGSRPDAPVWLSEISLWEIAMLHDLGRVQLLAPLGQWLDAVASSTRLRLHRITPAIAAETAALPSTFHRDPADRLIVATARTLGATLLTQDRAIIASRLVAIA